MSPFEQQICFPYTALTATGWAKPDWLLNAFQDAAAHHCHQMGISGFDMAEKGLKWVVAQYRMTIDAAIPWLSQLTLRTWRYPWKNLYDVRQFRLLDQEGRTLVSAAGVWILIKAGSGRPVRLSPHLPRELMQAEGADPLLIKSHPEILQPDHEARLSVRYQDMDLNQHVNNGVYLKWALAAMPHAFTVSHLPVGCTLCYLQEAFYPDHVACRIMTEPAETGVVTYHDLIPERTGRTAARACIAWKPLSGAESEGCHG